MGQAGQAKSQLGVPPSDAGRSIVVVGPRIACPGRGWAQNWSTNYDGCDKLPKGGKVDRATQLLNERVIPVLSAISENTYMSAIRAGMVSVVSLTIIGGFFIILLHLPIAGWESFMAPYQQLLQVPVTATFGLLSVFVCFAIAYDLGIQLKQEAIVSAMVATLIFLMIQVDLRSQSLSMDNLG
jgi:hypothetical protein